MKRLHVVGRLLAVAAVVFFFSIAVAVGSTTPAERIPPAAATRLAHGAAVGLKDLALDAVRAGHRILSGGAKLYARHCVACARLMADRAAAPRA
jgi:hypothetical protein